jgi:hypothetical protein
MKLLVVWLKTRTGGCGLLWLFTGLAQTDAVKHNR